MASTESLPECDACQIRLDVTNQSHFLDFLGCAAPLARCHCTQGKGRFQWTVPCMASCRDYHGLVKHLPQKVFLFESKDKIPMPGEHLQDLA